MYTDLKGDFAYVASNSLPSSISGVTTSFTYEITKETNSASIDSESSLGDINELGNFTTITFAENAPFLTGDRVFYTPDTRFSCGTVEGSYFVEVLASNKKTIKLFNSRSFVGTSDFVTFSAPSSGIGKHTFTLFEHKVGEIEHKNYLKNSLYLQIIKMEKVS